MFGSARNGRDRDTQVMSNGFVVPLRRRRDLEDLGWDSRQIARALEAGQLIALRRGVFARASELQDLRIEQQVVLRARSYRAIATSRQFSRVAPLRPFMASR
ncbi:hypothetical protein HR12_43145 [Microbacterium sp. SUBG005]|nr:hypothetical protein HR12_43145 [Microbacterium sp. SUBG005]